MFSNCENLLSANLSSFKSQNLESVYRMFYKCYNLLNVDLSSLSNINYDEKYNPLMFEDCYSLINVKIKKDLLKLFLNQIEKDIIELVD